ncbi:hypothetical protein BJY04DRAFT_186302 [Aspergillus karnatakaensis]|uniref:putative beta-N-acetylglucosaminidase n=1 Tax=Aspergillus karnatakaensis TaxID=1810916 RepID=UPI003CCD30A1
MSNPSIRISLFNRETDLDAIHRIWTTALPTYPLPKSHLEVLLPTPNAHHLTARKPAKTDTDPESNSTIIAFLLAYTSKKSTSTISVIAVLPDYQHQGIGSLLLSHSLQQFKSSFENEPEPIVNIGSTFPRFWPGIPKSLGEGVYAFFVKNGFIPKIGRSVDLYQDISDFSIKEEYVSRARVAGYRFAALEQSGYEECLRGQERNFADNEDWVKTYHTLPPTTHPDCIMAAFDPSGTQVAWTLMLPPTSPILKSNWAMPVTCGANTGLIGCVGVDKDHRRKSGVGLALVAHAVADLKRRGVQGVFVDWVVLEGFYERVGFGVWRGGYTEGRIL